MKNQLSQLIESYPREVSWKDIVDFDQFDERLSGIDLLVVNTIGVCEGSIEFCPDNEPPLKEEVLCWIWSFRPDLSDELLGLELSDDFRLLITCYKASSMDRFWNHFS